MNWAETHVGWRSRVVCAHLASVTYRLTRWGVNQREMSDNNSLVLLEKRSGNLLFRKKLTVSFVPNVTYSYHVGL